MSSSTPPSITRAEVAHLAGLSRLSLSDAEIDVFATQLGSILDHVRVVTEVAGADVEPLVLPLGNANVQRADVPVPGLTSQQALSGAPSEEAGRFAVPQILGEQ